MNTYQSNAQDSEIIYDENKVPTFTLPDPLILLNGEKGIETDKMPEANQPVGGKIKYHIHPGKHDLTVYDWERFMDFADIHLKENKFE